MREEVKNLFEQARKDLEAAEKIFKINEYYVSAFLCQQSIEKALKGFFILKNKKSPGNTHSLIFLASESGIPENFFSFLRNLTPEFITTRYPDVAGDAPYKLYDKKKVDNYLINSEGVNAMDRKPDKKTQALLKKHLVYLRKNFSPKKIILFGSRARGDNLESSDFDVIVVSEKFNGINFIDRLSLVYGFWNLKEGLDIIGYTPEEFEKKKNQIGIVQQAVKEGIEL